MCVFETFDPWAPLRSMTTLPFMILSLSYFVSRPYGPEGVPELRSDSLDVVFFFSSLVPISATSGGGTASVVYERPK